MAQVIIENPILNSPFEEPKQHFRFSDEGITNDIVEARRVSSYFIPIAKPKKKGKAPQLAFDTEWTKDRIEENIFINRVRERVSLWRRGYYQGITKTSRRLLDYWCNPERERKLFFCQIEAVETAIYITEVANRYGDSWIENELRRANEDANPELFRIAFKMATGSGKTIVMAMLIAWHVLNKLANRQDARFTDTFLIVTPGITIRDRLRVLLPNDPQNYYQQRDVLPTEWMTELAKAKIIITNFHAFMQRELVNAGKLTKSILRHGETNSLTETPDQMVRRVCRELGNKRNIIVINDEAHHCYRRRAGGEEVKLVGDEREEAKRYGKLTVLVTRMNPDLAMGDELLKKTGAGNLFTVFGEPDVDITKQKDNKIVVEIKGVDVYDPTTGQIRSSSTDDIACWFIDTDYNEESFFVRHAYFTGDDEPYEKLRRALKAEIDEAAWSLLYSTVSRPFDLPETGKIAIKVINHYGDEVLKVYEVG